MTSLNSKRSLLFGKPHNQLILNEKETEYLRADFQKNIKL